MAKQLRRLYREGHGSWTGSEPHWGEDPSQGRKTSWSGKDVLPETTRGRTSVWGVSRVDQIYRGSPSWRLKSDSVLIVHVHSSADQSCAGWLQPKRSNIFRQNNIHWVELSDSNLIHIRLTFSLTSSTLICSRKERINSLKLLLLAESLILFAGNSHLKAPGALGCFYEAMKCSVLW